MLRVDGFRSGPTIQLEFDSSLASDIPAGVPLEFRSVGTILRVDSHKSRHRNVAAITSLRRKSTQCNCFWQTPRRYGWSCLKVPVGLPVGRRSSSRLAAQQQYSFMLQARSRWKGGRGRFLQWQCKASVVAADTVWEVRHGLWPVPISC